MALILCVCVLSEFSHRDKQLKPVLTHLTIILDLQVNCGFETLNVSILCFFSSWVWNEVSYCLG